MKIRKMNMNILWKKMMRRYKNMGNLLVAVLCIMLGIVLHYSPSIVKHVMAGGDELLLGGVYACNLLTLIILCIKKSVRLLRRICFCQYGTMPSIFPND